MNTNTAWAAGFMDNAAEISILPNKLDSPHVVVTLPVRPPCARLEQLFGGSLEHIRMQGEGKKVTVFRWEVTGARAMHCLVEILPGLHLKAAVARNALYYGWYDSGSPSFWKRLFSRKRRNHV